MDIIALIAIKIDRWGCNIYYIRAVGIGSLLFDETIGDIIRNIISIFVILCVFLLDLK